MYWYFGTEQGSTIRSTGSNPAMSKAQGININFTKVIALALSNGLVALSGSLFAQYQGFADINMGRGAIVIGLAAVIIGEVLGEAIFRKHMNFIIRMVFVIVGGILYYIAMGIVLCSRCRQTIQSSSRQLSLQSSLQFRISRKRERLHSRKLQK